MFDILKPYLILQERKYNYHYYSVCLWCASVGWYLYDDLL